MNMSWCFLLYYIQIYTQKEREECTHWCWDGINFDHSDNHKYCGSKIKAPLKMCRFWDDIEIKKLLFWHSPAECVTRKKTTKNSHQYDKFFYNLNKVERMRHQKMTRSVKQVERLWIFSPNQCQQNLSVLVYLPSIFKCIVTFFQIDTFWAPIICKLMKVWSSVFKKIKLYNIPILFALFTLAFQSADWIWPHLIAFLVKQWRLLIYFWDSNDWFVIPLLPLLLSFF